MQLAQLELAEMMGRGCGRSLLLLGAVATLLVISSSAVTGVPDAYVRDMEVLEHHQGIVEKARSFLSGLATSIGNGISSPSSFLWEKKHWAGPEKAEKTFGRRTHIRGRQSRWAGIRDLIVSFESCELVDKSSSRGYRCRSHRGNDFEILISESEAGVDIGCSVVIVS